mmetsp:Transcript_47206/g.94471  ORF Transcript_47206/g.94471 Transcript_47206/m.94471 type:complete len:167 (-) Transcript_47206:51-551(-)
MADIARTRLTQERKAWRRDHPFGFFARLAAKPDGSLDLMTWRCGIPGKEKTIWEGGLFELTMEFSEDYPHKPPRCRFAKGFFHPNVYPSGTVCLSILNEEQAWKPGISIKQILLGIQDLLDDPNELSPAQAEALEAFHASRQDYEQRVRRQVRDNPPDRFQGERTG